MSELTMREAIKLAIAEEMRADPSVVVFGEDVAEAGGVFKVTAGLLEEFGPDRVRDTPISETAIIGAAIGAAANGLRPVVEIMFAEFFGVALDQVVTQAAKMRYLSAGKLRMPIVMRASAGGGLGFGTQHSQTLESWFMNTPGLTVVSPSGAASAYGLLRHAIRGEDPVVFLEPRNLYGWKEEFDPGETAIWPLGTARLARDGADVTLVALGQMSRVALNAAATLAERVSCAVIDLGTVRPWDRDTVLASVRRTGRLVIVEENPVTGGWGADVASAVASMLHGRLKAPVARVACPDVPIPSRWSSAPMSGNAAYCPSRRPFAVSRSCRRSGLALRIAAGSLRARLPTWWCSIRRLWRTVPHQRNRRRHRLALSGSW